MLHACVHPVSVAQQGKSEAWIRHRVF
jgi:hypothetical protein